MTEIIHPNIVRLYGLMNEGTHTKGHTVHHEVFEFHTECFSCATIKFVTYIGT